MINQANNRLVSMPSQVIDLAWHEFILFTREYEQFCKQGFGHFLHHTPAEAMKSATVAQEGIKRAWRIACYREGINPQKPTKLPLIFAIDGNFNIEDGFRYHLNCMAGQQKKTKEGGDYCGSHIGCASGCSGTSGDSSCGGDGGGCGGGD